MGHGGATQRRDDRVDAVVLDAHQWLFRSLPDFRPLVVRITQGAPSRVSPSLRPGRLVETDLLGDPLPRARLVLPVAARAPFAGGSRAIARRRVRHQVTSADVVHLDPQLRGVVGAQDAGVVRTSPTSADRREAPGRAVDDVRHITGVERAFVRSPSGRRQHHRLDATWSVADVPRSSSRSRGASYCRCRHARSLGIDGSGASRGGSRCHLVTPPARARSRSRTSTSRGVRIGVAGGGDHVSATLTRRPTLMSRLSRSGRTTRCYRTTCPAEVGVGATEPTTATHRTRRRCRRRRRAC